MCTTGPDKDPEMDLDGSPDEESTVADQEDPTLKHRRSERSLHLLATRFVALLRETEGGVLDLKDAVRILAVGKKRRIYDITNVLEGVGLIMKISKSVVKWKGALPGESANGSSSRQTRIQSELDELEQREFTLDQHKVWVEQSIKNTMEDCSNLTYVNHEDLCSCFSDNTLLAVRAPSGTQLDVPIPKAVLNSPAQYQIYLKSINGPIDVVLLNKLTASSVPVVLPVPPSEEILQRARSAMLASKETESSFSSSQASAMDKHSQDKSHLHSSLFRTRERDTSNASQMRDLSKELRELLNPGMTASKETESSFSSSQASAIDKHSQDKSYLQSSLFRTRERDTSKASQMRDLSKELRELLNPVKEIKKENLLSELMASEVFSPLLRLSPPPSARDYAYNLEESDLFDLPMLNV